MDMFPEIFSGEAGISNLQFATGFSDQTPGAGNFAVAELYNPAIANPNASVTLPMVTVCGLVLFGAAAGDWQILKAATATDVSTAATAGPQWMDQRRTDTGLATFKMGTPNSIPGTLLTAVPFGASDSIPVFFPFNWDLPQGTGLNFAFNTAATRGAITVFWIERTQTV
jgi:hypothetical protein